MIRPLLHVWVGQEHCREILAFGELESVGFAFVEEGHLLAVGER